MYKNKWIKVELGLIILFMGIALIVAVWGMGVVNRNTVLDYNANYLQDSTKYYIESINDVLQGKLRFVENMASMVGYEESITADSLRQALYLIENNSYYDELYFMDEKGLRWYPDGSCEKKETEEMFQNAMMGKSGMENGICQINHRNVYYFSFYAPVWKEGKTIGVLVGQNYYYDFSDLHHSISQNEGVSDFLISVNGDILLQNNYSEYDENLLQTLQNNMNSRDYEQMVWDLQHNLDGIYVYRDDNGKGNICIYPLVDGKLFLVKMYSSKLLKTMVQDANRAFYKVVFAIFIFVGLSGIMACHLVWKENNKKSVLLNMSLDALGEAIPRIAHISYEKNECIFVKENENAVEEVFRKYDWKEVRENLIHTVHPEDLEMVRAFSSTENMRRIWESGRDSDTCIYRREYKGEIQWIQTVILPIRAQKGEKQMLMYARLVDDSVRAAELYKTQLIQTLQQAKKAEGERTEFLKYLSREMHTPIDSVLEMAALAEQAIKIGDLETAARCLKRVENAGNNMGMILDDITQLGIVNSRSLHSKEDIISIENVVEDCKEAFRNFKLAEETEEKKDKQVALAVEIEPSVYPEYRGDEYRLTQALSAMLSNAYKYSEKQGNVLLRFKVEALEPALDRLIIEVEDQGCGMKESYLPLVYEPFSKENRISENLDSGVGLGLYLAKLAVDAMHGQLCVESEVEKGSKFTVILDLKHAQQLNDEMNSATRVLVVDDNELNLHIMTDMLQHDGFEVTSCNSGFAAIREFEQSAQGMYDVILTDLKMPEMDGYQLARCVRESNHPDSKEILIVAISGAFEDNMMEKVVEHGIDKYLRKPFNIEEFLQLIQKK